MASLVRIRSTRLVNQVAISLWAISLCGVLAGCVDSFTDPKLETDASPSLVIEGLITTDLAPFSVTVTKSLAFLPLGVPEGITNATVRIADNLNNVVPLVHTRRGMYVSPEAQRAVVGRSYRLLIKLADGRTYESQPEIVRPVVAIDSVVSTQTTIVDGNGVKKVGFEVYADARDASTTGDFYRWDWTNYQYLGYCLNRYCGPPNCIPTVFRSECCEPCWSINRPYGQVILTSDNLINGNKIRQKMTTVTYESRRPYFVEIRLSSLTREAYQYWKNVNTQINNTGSIFDAPPATIRGNVRNVNDPTEQVLGYFGASAVSYRRTYVMRSLVTSPPAISILPGRVLFERECVPCTESPLRTRRKPVGWRDEYNTLFWDPVVEL